MCRRMIFLVSLVSVLALVLTNLAQADLIGYWRFDESSGTIAADSAGGDNDGILFGDQLEWAAGRSGGALSHGGLWDAGVEFLTNDVAYSHYQVLFPAVRDNGSANSMQIAEMELIGVPTSAGPVVR